MPDLGHNNLKQVLRVAQPGALGPLCRHPRVYGLGELAFYTDSGTPQGHHPAETCALRNAAAPPAGLARLCSAGWTWGLLPNQHKAARCVTEPFIL